MAERDPFGRLPDENPLAGLGTLSDGIESQAPAQPVVAAGSSDDAPDELWRGAAGKRERRRGVADPGDAAAGSPEATLRDLLVTVQRLKSGAVAGAPAASVVVGVGRAVKAAFVIAVIVLIVSGLVGLATLGDNVRDGLPPGESGQRAPAAAPVGLAGGSLLSRRNLAPALRRMRTSGLGRLRSLSIRPERLDAQLLTRDGRLRSVQQRFDGRLRTISLSGRGFAALPTIAFARANPAAPSRLARSAAARAKRPVSQIDYVALVAGPAAAWTVAMKAGGLFAGDARGRITRRIG